MKTHDYPLSESNLIAFIMSAIAGFSDVFGFIALQQLFTSHITGNIVLIITYAIDKTPGLISRVLTITIFICIAIIVSLSYPLIFFKRYLTQRGASRSLKDPLQYNKPF